MNGNKIFKSFIQGKLHEAEEHLIENLNQLAAMVIDGQKKLMATGIVSEASTDPMEHANKAVKPVKVRGYDKNHKKKELKFESIEAFEEWADSELAEEFDIHEILEDVEQIDEIRPTGPLILHKDKYNKTNELIKRKAVKDVDHFYKDAKDDPNKEKVKADTIAHRTSGYKFSERDRRSYNNKMGRYIKHDRWHGDHVKEDVEQIDENISTTGYDAARKNIKWWKNPHKSGSKEAYEWDKGHTQFRRSVDGQKKKLAKEDEIDPSLKLSDKREVMEGSEATRKILLAKVRAGFGKAEKSEREPIKRYPDEHYKNMEKRAMEKRARNEDVEQIDELDHQQGILHNYLGKVRRMKDGGEKLPKKRQDGYNLALKKKWGDKKYGLPEPKVKAVNR